MSDVLSDAFRLSYQALRVGLELQNLIADLQTGKITKEAAKERLQNLEAQFLRFDSMDDQLGAKLEEDR